MKIRPVGAGRTDMTKLIVAFRNFPNAPKIYAATENTSSDWVVLLNDMSLRKNTVLVLRKIGQVQQENAAKKKLNARKLTIVKFSIVMT